MGERQPHLWSAQRTLQSQASGGEEFATAYESECEPEWLYGAIKMVPGGPYDVEQTIPVQCEFVLAVAVRPAG